MRFEIVAEYRSVINKTFCIFLMDFEESIHKLLYVGRRIDESHQYDTKDFLTSVCNNSDFPAILKSDIHLIKGFLQIQKRNPILAQNSANDILLVGQRIRIGNDFGIKPAKIHHRSTTAFGPNHENRPTRGVCSFRW